MPRYPSLVSPLLYSIEDFADKIFTPRDNPFYFLGALSTFFFLLIFISGTYLFIFYKVDIPYKSVQYMAEGQRLYGGIIRSIHRYAADGLIISVVLHMLWVFFKGRYFLWRRIMWISGVILLVVFLIDGIIGYWLVWDERAKAVAIITSKILSSIPVFIEPPPMGFLSNATMSRPLFFILTFFHILLPFLSLLILWIHLSRISRPVIIPTKMQIYGILLAMLIFSILYPASIGPPADVQKLPVDVSIDWFYLFLYPLFSTVTPAVFYPLIFALLFLVFLLPWIGSPERIKAPEVSLENCTGCSLCYKDCPYEAISMQSRSNTNGNGKRLEAVVSPALCAGCGICVGACNYNAINLLGRTETQIKEEIKYVLSTIAEKGES